MFRHPETKTNKRTNKYYFMKIYIRSSYLTQTHPCPSALVEPAAVVPFAVGMKPFTDFAADLVSQFVKKNLINNRILCMRNFGILFSLVACFVYRFFTARTFSRSHIFSIPGIRVSHAPERDQGSQLSPNRHLARGEGENNNNNNDNNNNNKTLMICS